MMGIFGGLFGGRGTQQQFGLPQEPWTHQWSNEQLRFAGLMGMAGSGNIANRYFEGMQNNCRVECAYCHTPRMSMHKECKACGASEVME
jgi:hypothetical protein